jgi:hypothetical protein
MHHHRSGRRLTVLARPQPPAWQLEEVGAQLQKQNVWVVVLLNEQDALHRPTHAIALIPAVAE